MDSTSSEVCQDSQCCFPNETDDECPRCAGPRLALGAARSEIYGEKTRPGEK